MVVEVCREHKVSVVVVGPEDPLAAGLANFLATAGIKVSKSFIFVANITW